MKHVASAEWNLPKILDFSAYSVYAARFRNHHRHRQEAQLSQRDRATLYASWNLVSYCATVRKSHF